MPVLILLGFNEGTGHSENLEIACGQGVCYHPNAVKIPMQNALWNLRESIMQRLFLCFIVSLFGLWLLACARRPAQRVPVTSSGALGVNEARNALQHLGGANWSGDQIELKSISNGVGSDNAVVEARIETAFRLSKQSGDWRVAEIRLGDRQWESLELVEVAVRREKERRTAGLLQRFADALQAYQREKGAYPDSEDIAVLLDYLSPRYLVDPIRFDWWGTQFSYRGTATSYRMSSAGHDRKSGTKDDITLENGVLRAQND